MQFYGIIYSKRKKNIPNEKKKTIFFYLQKRKKEPAPKKFPKKSSQSLNRINQIMFMSIQPKKIQWSFNLCWLGVKVNVS